jgi:hypothetical protein
MCEFSKFEFKVPMSCEYLSEHFKNVCSQVASVSLIRERERKKKKLE